MKQRGTFAITTLILKAVASRRLTRTRLTEELVLKYDGTIVYTELLVQRGLINYNNNDRTFGLTPRGQAVLSLSEELASCLSPLDDFIDKYGSIYPPVENHCHPQSML